MTRCLLVLLVASLFVGAACGGIASGVGKSDRDATAPNPSRSGASGSSGANSGLLSSSGAGVGTPLPGSGLSPNGCPPASPLSCFVSHCSNGAHTTLTGKVYDPAGKVPLYNVVVFVPNDSNNLPPIALGTSSCGSCPMSIGSYVSAAVTDKTGAFTLRDVPTDYNVPLVVLG